MTYKSFFALFAFIAGAGLMYLIPNLEVDGFSQLGSDAPPIKMYKFEGTTPDSNNLGEDFEYIVDLPASAIISYKTLVFDADEFYGSEGFPNIDYEGFEYYTYFEEGPSPNTTSFYIYYPSNSGSFELYNRPFKVLFIYDDDISSGRSGSSHSGGRRE